MIVNIEIYVTALSLELGRLLRNGIGRLISFIMMILTFLYDYLYNLRSKPIYSVVIYMYIYILWLQYLNLYGNKAAERHLGFKDLHDQRLSKLLAADRWKFMARSHLYRNFSLGQPTHTFHAITILFTKV